MASHTYSKEAHSRAVVKFVKNKLDRIEMRCTKESGLKQEIVEHILFYFLCIFTYCIYIISSAPKVSITIFVF